MTRTLDLTRQFTLAARAVAGLTTRLDLAGFVDVTLERIDILVIEALALRAVLRLAIAAAREWRRTTTTAAATFAATFTATFTASAAIITSFTAATAALFYCAFFRRCYFFTRFIRWAAAAYFISHYYAP